MAIDGKDVLPIKFFSPDGHMENWSWISNHKKNMSVFVFRMTDHLKK